MVTEHMILYIESVMRACTVVYVHKNIKVDNMRNVKHETVPFYHRRILHRLVQWQNTGLLHLRGPSDLM